VNELPVLVPTGGGDEVNVRFWHKADIVQAMQNVR
jgi:hypothetical protein